jgi:hypothetical protein
LTQTFVVCFPVTEVKRRNGYLIDKKHCGNLAKSVLCGMIFGIGLLELICVFSFAHGVGTDANGCHVR